MIAPGGHCQTERLERLLQSRLDRADEQAITVHLDHCPKCREELQRIAGSAAMWKETRCVLKDSSELRSPFSNPPHNAVEESHQWLSRLLHPSPDPSLLGMLDEYPVQSVIGHGGMGVVMRVWDANLHRPLAIKLLSPMLANNGAARKRFFREAQAVASVVHPNIVPIYTVATDSSLPYIVMPLIGGGNLQQRIEQEGPLSLHEILTFGLQIAEALRAAHSQGLVHRDIKPANILLDDGGHRVMISDFGLARALDDASITASGMIAGTPHYMSPEQARGDTVDARSDIYSLGAVLYAMATGHPPARGETALAVLRRVAEDKPRPIHDLNESMPAWLNRLIGMFLEKSLDNRIVSADVAAELLRGCLAHVRAPSRIPLPRELRANRVQIRLAWSIALILSACLLGTAGNWTWRYWSTPSAIETQSSSSIPAYHDAWENLQLDAMLSQTQNSLRELNASLEWQLP